MKQKVLSIFGTRPEGIKMAPVIQELQKCNNNIISKTCVTGQHRYMLDQVLNLFKIKPNYDLNIMQINQHPIDVTAAVLQGLKPIMEFEKPDWVLVQGDTTTVMAASIAAFYLGFKVGHVEAGLRTNDIYQPFPEEVNRRIADVVATLHFAPTQWAAENLQKEGVGRNQIIITGNTVIDAIRQVADMPFNPTGGPLADLPLRRKRIILVTAHRRESFGRGIEEICAALQIIASSHHDVQIVYLVHPNPNVWEPVHHLLGDVPNVSLLPPLDYHSFVHLMKHAYLILTDSGGIQEEAPGLGVPVLVLREVTERPEAVAAGTAKVVGNQCANIATEALKLLEDTTAYRQMAQAANPFGDGQAAVRIVQALLGEKIQSCGEASPSSHEKDLPIIIQ